MKQTLTIPEKVGILHSQSDVVVKALLPYLKSLGYSELDLEFEKPFTFALSVQIGSKKVSIRRPDILVKLKDRYVMVVEAKNPEQAITKEAVDQATSYAVLLGAPFAMVSNGEVVEMFKVYSILKHEQVPILTKDQILREAFPTFSKTDMEEAKKHLLPLRKERSLQTSSMFAMTLYELKKD